MSGYYLILRGQEGARVAIGELLLPPTARLRLQKLEEVTIEPFDMIPLVNLTQADMGGHRRGLIFMTSLFVKSGSECFLEGCFHLLSDGAPFPGVTLSTGGEE